MTICKKITFFCLLSLWGCTSFAEAQEILKNKFDGYPTVKESLNKRIFVTEKSYYLLAKSSDTTVNIIWGNDTLKRVFFENIELPFAEKLHLSWVNNEYLILKHSTGSGSWINIIMPFNKTEDVQEFSNGLYFDSINNLFVTEQYGDTILLIRNLKSRDKQYIIEKEKPCESALNSSCIDNIRINNKQLYFRWIVPYKLSDKKVTQERKIPLHI